MRTGELFRHFAYVPLPLPYALELDELARLAVAEAETALAGLERAVREHSGRPWRRLPHPARFAYAVAPQRSLIGQPFTLRLIGQLYRLIVDEEAEASRDEDVLRTGGIMVGNGSISDAFLVPPVPDDLRTGIERLHWWMNVRSELLPPVARGALAHYQFETLHPLPDGNGRVGRLLIGLQLSRDGALQDETLLELPWFEAKDADCVVTPWFKAYRNDYAESFLDLQATGDWNSWIRSFAAWVAAGADATRHAIAAFCSER